MRNYLSIASLHDFFQRVVGRDNAYRIMVERFVQPSEHMAILELGCGTGELLAYLPQPIQYKGYDLSSNYIHSATTRFPSLGAFNIGCVPDCLNEELQNYDVVIAFGLIHHLTDKQTSEMLAKVSSILKPSGRFISLDGVYTPDQSRVTRFLLDSDRGEYVRCTEGYLQLAIPHFKQVDHVIAHDWLRIPYTHIIMVGKNS